MQGTFGSKGLQGSAKAKWQDKCKKWKFCELTDKLHNWAGKSVLNSRVFQGPLGKWNSDSLHTKP